MKMFYRFKYDDLTAGSHIPDRFMSDHRRPLDKATLETGANDLGDSTGVHLHYVEWRGFGLIWISLSGVCVIMNVDVDQPSIISEAPPC